MHRLDTTRMGADPGNRIGARCDTCAHIELQYDRRIGVFREVLRWILAVDLAEFGFVIVIAHFQSSGLEFFGGGVEGIGDRLPAIGTGVGLGAGHDDVLAAECEIEVLRAVDLVWVEIVEVVVRREAADAEIVQQLAHVFGLLVGALEVGSIELDTFVSHLADGAYGRFGIFLELLADGVEFEAHGNLGVGGACRVSVRKHGRKGQERPAVEWGHGLSFYLSRLGVSKEIFGALCFGWIRALQRLLLFDEGLCGHTSVPRQRWDRAVTLDGALRKKTSFAEGIDMASVESAIPVAATSSPLSKEELRRMNAYWRAANYLSVGQIYLYGNPLLREPLKIEHVKPRLLGHWGTTPGLNFIYVHCNRLIKKLDLNMIYITGPGHGGPGLVANTYLEGTYSEYYPNIPQNETGMKRLFKQFSFPGGIPSHVAPETPGSIHEGGELGYCISHACGAAFDNPDLLAL